MRLLVAYIAFAVFGALSAQRFRDRCRDDDDYYQTREIHGSRSPLRIFNEHEDPDLRIADYELESKSRQQSKDSGPVRRSFVPPAEIPRVPPIPRAGWVDSDLLYYPRSHYYPYRRSFEDPTIITRRKGKSKSHINVTGINTNVNVADHSGYIAKDNSPPAGAAAEPKSPEGPGDADKGSDAAPASGDSARRDSGILRSAPGVEGTAQVVYVSGKSGHHGARRIPITTPKPPPPTKFPVRKSFEALEPLNRNKNRNVNPNKDPGGPKVRTHSEAHRRSFGRMYRPHLNDNQNLNININRPSEEEEPRAPQYYYTYY